MQTVKSRITKGFRTTIPLVVRNQLNLKAGNSLVWLVGDNSARVVALPPNTLRSLRGSARGEDLHEALMEERWRERGR